MNGQVVRGQVTRVSGGQVWAIIPRLGKGERGPLPYMRQRVTIPALVTDTVEVHSHTTEQVTVWSDPPKAGDTVIVAVIEGSMDELVVLGVQA